MKKFLHSLLMLFMGFTTAAFAGQSGPHDWNGKNKTLTLKADTAITFSYIAAERGILYIYTDNQGSSDNVPLTLEGGWYNEGAYVEDSPLLGIEDYENGLGFFGYIKVLEGDEIRFTISTPKEVEGSSTRFTLKSAFFNESVGGDSWENAIALPQDKAVAIPIYENSASDVLSGLWITNATFCKFTAPDEGIATILTGENVVYVLEEKNIGSVEHRFKAVSQDASTNDHEFIVSAGEDYIVVVPNTRPSTLTFKMTGKKVGQSAKFPIEITKFPATLDLVKGDNYYAFSHELIGATNMLEIATAAWNGTITYMEDPTEESTELVANTVAGVATFVKNVDPRYLYGSNLIVNFNMTDAASLVEAATLSLREPKAGESFETAIAVNFGENTINNAGDVWFKYTAEMDAEYSFATTGTLKHVNFYPGVEQKVADNIYRIGEGQTVYVCVTAVEGNTFTVSGNEIVDGDYCDRPVYFELGQDVVIKNRGRDYFFAFYAEADGYAIFNSTNWTVNFYDECGGRRLDNTRTVEESGNDVKYSYKLPVYGGQLYIAEVTALSEDITIKTAFEVAVAGGLCSTAIEIEKLGENIEIAYEFGKTKWFKITAEKSGFYSAYAKLGYNGYVGTKLGSCDAEEYNADSDNSHSNAYMGGYKVATEYVEEGQTLYINTRTGSSNDEEQFGANFYLVVTYTEARPGEAPAVAIEAEPYTDYTVMKNDEEGYEQWYVYTIPAGKEASISMTASVKYISKCLNFCPIEDAYKYLKANTDYVQSNITNEEETVIGKKFDFVAIDTDRTFYIKVSTVNAMYYPVKWRIDGEGLSTVITVEDVTDEASAIYDLMGRRVENPGKGIYIINGVKRVIK